MEFFNEANCISQIKRNIKMKKTCQTCKYNSPEKCGFIKLSQNPPKNVTVNVNMIHNCPDYEKKEK